MRTKVRKLQQQHLRLVPTAGLLSPLVSILNKIVQNNTLQSTSNTWLLSSSCKTSLHDKTGEG